MIPWHTWHKPQTLLDKLIAARYNLTQVIPGGFPDLGNLTPIGRLESGPSKALGKDLATSKLNSKDKVDLILSNKQNLHPEA